MPLVFQEVKGSLPVYELRDLEQQFKLGQNGPVYTAEKIPAAIRSIQNFLAHHDMKVALGLDSKKIADVPMLEKYIDESYELQLGDSRMLRSINFNHHESIQVPMENSSRGSDVLGLKQESYLQEHPDSLCSLIELSIKPFSSLLQDIMEKRGLNRLETYKGANLDRREFLELLETPGRVPDKKTLCALGLSLQLDSQELEALLAKYGFGLSDNSIADLIVRFFAEQGIFDIDTINLALFKHSQPQLGSV